MYDEPDDQPKMRRDRISVMGALILGSLIGILLVLRFGIFYPNRTSILTEGWNGALMLAPIVAVFFLLRGLYGPEDEDP